MPCAATAWRRKQQRGTQRFTTASFITSLNHSSCCSKQRQPFKQVPFTILIRFHLSRAASKKQVCFSPAVNSAGETALDIAKRLQHTQCIDLVRPHFPHDVENFRFSKITYCQKWARNEGWSYKIKIPARKPSPETKQCCFHSWKYDLKKTPHTAASGLQCASFRNWFYFLTGHLPRWIRLSSCNILFDCKWPCFTGCWEKVGKKK